MSVPRVPEPRDPERYAPKEPLRHRRPDYPDRDPLGAIAFGVEAIGRAGVFGRPFAADLARLVALERHRLDTAGDPRRDGAPDVLRPSREALSLADALRREVWERSPKGGNCWGRFRDLKDALWQIAGAERVLAQPAPAEAPADLLDLAQRLLTASECAIAESRQAVAREVRLAIEAVYGATLQDRPPAAANHPRGTRDPQGAVAARQPSLGAMRGMSGEQRRRALTGMPSRAAQRRRARHALAAGFRVLAGVTRA